MPEVNEFISCTSSVSPYKYSDTDTKISISDNSSYIVNLNWSYKEEMNYQKKATIRLVHEDKILSIVSID